MLGLGQREKVRLFMQSIEKKVRRMSSDTSTPILLHKIIKATKYLTPIEWHVWIESGSWLENHKMLDLGVY